MRVLEYESRNGYSGKLFGAHRIEIADKYGDVVLSVPTRNVYNYEELAQRVADFPKLRQKMEELGRVR